MQHCTILNYLLAYSVDLGPVSTTAQGKLCGIDQLHRKPWSELVSNMPEGTEGIAAEHVT